MKKFAVLFMCALLFALPITLTGCQKDSSMTTIRLNEVTHSIFYAPLYVAINNGYFEDEGIKIELVNGGGADKVMTAIASKSADIGLMGPEATIYCHVEGQRDYPIIFGQLTQRDGSFLVARTEQKDFKWSDLKGKHMLAGRPGGVPAMTLQYVVETKGGLDLSELNFDTDVAFDAMVGAFEGDKSIDYCTMFEPTASDFVRNGKGYIVASVGEAGGDIPYTSFSASKSYLTENRDLVKTFLACVIKGYEFIKSNDSMTVAAALEPSFAGTSLELMASSVERYLSIDAWCHTPVMSETSFNRLQEIMENSGNLSGRANFSLAVDNSIAKELVG